MKPRIYKLNWGVWVCCGYWTNMSYAFKGYGDNPRTAYLKWAEIIAGRYGYRVALRKSDIK